MEKVTTTISSEFKALAMQFNIKYSEALRVGMAIILAEKGVKEYDNTLILHRKMRAYQSKVEELYQKFKVGNAYSLEEKREVRKDV
jgi:hypothetical protein|tara:strand:+ start:270 stop:527 length:258 start_codon:yes stop_codon:yes gene_type:complete